MGLSHEGLITRHIWLHYFGLRKKKYYTYYFSYTGKMVMEMKITMLIMIPFMPDDMIHGNGRFLSWRMTPCHVMVSPHIYKFYIILFVCTLFLDLPKNVKKIQKPPEKCSVRLRAQENSLSGKLYALLWEG